MPSTGWDATTRTIWAHSSRLQGNAGAAALQERLRDAGITAAVVTATAHELHVGGLFEDLVLVLTVCDLLADDGLSRVASFGNQMYRREAGDRRYTAVRCDGCFEPESLFA